MVQQVRVYLGLPSTDRPDDLLRDDHDLERHESLPSEFGPGAAFFWAEGHTSIPRWVEWLQSLVAIGLSASPGVSRSGILVVRRQERWVALAFGNGWNKIDSQAVEGDFGIRVTLNLIDLEKVKTLDSRTFGANPRHTIRQLAQAGSLDDFGIEYFEDFIRLVEGAPESPDYGKLLSGSDALVVKADLNRKNLLPFIDKLVDAYSDERFREIAPFLQRIRSVKNQAQREQLDGTLVEVIATSDSKPLIVPPDLIPEKDIQGFRFRRGATFSGYLEMEPEMHTYLEFVEQGREILTPQRLRSDHLEAVSTDDSVIASWPVYQCVYAEIGRDDGAFFLSEGRWYEIQEEFTKQINRQIQDLSCSVELPAAEISEHEPDYNRRAAIEMDYALVDGNLVRIPDERGGIEICDMFTKHRHLIHVKSFRGSSTTSHLFMQGLNSATVLNNAGTATDFQRLLERLNRPHEARLVTVPIQTDAYTVTFGLIVPARYKLPDDLPIFTKLSLDHNVRNLRRMGYKVCLTKISRNA